MATKKETFSGIDVGQSTICYTQCVAETRTIINIGIQPLEDPGKDYWKSVKNGFDELFKQVERVKDNVVVSLPAEYAIVKRFPFEQANENQEEYVAWELGQQVISPVEEYLYDYRRIPVRCKEADETLLVVGYRSSIISRISKLLKPKKLNPGIVDLDVFALINVFEANYPEYIADPAVILLSDVYRTKLILTHRGTYIDMEIVEYPESGSHNANATDSFTDQLKTGLAILVERNSEAVQYEKTRLLLTGNYFSIPEVVRQVQSVFQKGEILDPFRSIKCTPGMDSQKLNKYATIVAASVGLAIRESQPEA